jgi:hypothetical protein
LASHETAFLHAEASGFVEGLFPVSTRNCGSVQPSRTSPLMKTKIASPPTSLHRFAFRQHTPWSRCFLGALLAVGCLLAAHAQAATFTVNATTDTGAGSGLTGDLRYCLNQANPIAGSNTITFNIPAADSGCTAANVCTITLGSTLPAIDGDATIDGTGQSITVSGNDSVQVMSVNPGRTLSLKALTIAHGACLHFCVGGGLVNYGTVNVTNTTFSNNSALDGAGIYNRQGGAVKINSSTFSDNSVLDTGAGIYNEGTLEVTNSTFYRNLSQGTGGIYNEGTLKVTNSTFSNNTAGTGFNSIVSFGTATVTNTIISRGTGILTYDACYGVTAGSDNLADDHSCDGATQKTTAEINLQPLGNNGGPTKTMALGAGSAAIDHGSNVLAVDTIGNPLTTDQRGFARTVKGTVDIGAYEVQLPVVTFGTPPTGLTDPQNGAAINLTTLLNPGSAGTFTGDGVTNNIFNPAGLGIGGHAIAFTATTPDAYGNFAIASFSILVTEAQSLVVTTDSDASTNLDSQTSLREALAYAQQLRATQTIAFSNSAVNGATNFYDGSAHTITLGGTELPISSSVTLAGPGANLLTINGNHASRVFNVAGGVTATLDSLTVANGNSDYTRGPAVAGGISNGGTLNISRSIISGNSCTAFGRATGGGVYNVGTLNITGSTVSGNSVSGGHEINLGGGIYNTGAVTITGSTLSGNSASHDGTADNDGGAIYSVGGITTLVNSTVAGNWISGNAASNYGGGILVASTTLTLVNCTITGNSASLGRDNVGGGIATASGVVANIRNTIIAGNSANDGPDVSVFIPFTSQGYNLIGKGDGGSSSFTNGSNGDQVGTSGSPLDPKLSALGNYGGPTKTHAPLAGSPTIDAGSNALAVDANNNPLTADQRGLARTVNGKVDIGAVEVPLPPVITLMGANPMTVECHSLFTDPGASVSENGAGSLPATTTGSVDANTPGSYTLAYNAVAAFGNNATPVTRTVNVVDTTRPVITLFGANPITVECSASFTDPGATASDTCAGNLTSSIVRTGSVSNGVPGTYTLTYNVQDPSSNHAVTVTRTVKVVDTTAPVINSVTAPAPAQANSNCQAPVLNVLPGVSYSDCSSVTLTQSPAAGALVGVGQTTITITAKDAFTNTSTRTTAFTVNSVPTYAVSIAPATVKQGGQVTLNTTSSNCGSTAVQLSLQATLVEPKSKTLIATVPVTLAAGQHGTSTMQITVPKSTKLGLYTLTVDVYLGSTKLSTSTAQVTVTK